MLVPTILSGGNGSRLWPVSREAHPKPFIRLNKDTHSLLQKTYQRATNIPNVQQIITVTNFEYYYQSKNELKDLTTLTKSKDFNFLLEPISRNTSSAIALSALFIQRLFGPDTVLLVLPSDHIILNQVKFNRCVKLAYQLAKKGLLITFGITPNKPETAYGYIEYGHSKVLEPAYHVKNFYEKPCYEKVLSFIEQGNYLWNSGIFCFTASTLLHTLKKYNLEFYNKILHCWKVSEGSVAYFQNNSEKKFRFDQKSFSKLDNISIDYALLEKAKNMVVIPAEFGWSDIGSWDSLSKLIKPDKKGNRVLGSAILRNTYDTTVYNQNTPGRLITVLGVKNLTIVDTSDALLICEQTQLQQVKQLVDELKSHGHDAYRYHQRVNRPWGHYTVLDQGQNYKLKRIVVHPGANLSLQLHHYRSEYWVVVKGIATVQNNQKTFLLKPQESTFIPIGNKHCLSNFGLNELTVIELQIGNYLSEDDIIRFKDDYDRANKDYKLTEEVKLSTIK